MDQRFNRERLGFWLLWAVIIAVAAYLRFWQVGMQIVIDDEWHAINKLKSAGYLDILLTFGRADHSIPLTIYYKAIADTMGLTEWGLRLPMLIFGLGTVAITPWLFRHWLSPIERLAGGALLAISPVLIHFSRTGRPYAITILLCIVALVAFYRWWTGSGRKPAYLYIICTVAAAYLHPISLTFSFACLAWAGLLALRSAYLDKSFEPVMRVIQIALPSILICTVLLLPPLWHDYAALAAKAGVHYVHFSTIVAAWQLLVGTGYASVALIALGFTLFGAFRLYCRYAQLMGYLLFVVLVALLLVVLSGPEWIQHGRLLMRYMLPALPLALMFMAVGLTEVLGRISPGRWLKAVQLTGLTAGAIALFFLGPLPTIYQGINQFTGHQSYQFDYNYQSNAYRQFLSIVKTPPIYQRIAGLDSGPGWEIIETPWRLESFYNPLYLYQQIHQLPIRIGFMSGLCSDPFYGEYGLHKEGLQFEYFVHLKELLADPGEKQFLIFHLVPAIKGMREIPAVEPCIKAFRARYGEPWYESDRLVVYRFGPRSQRNG